MPRLAQFAILLACSLSALAAPRAAPWAAALEAGGSALIVSVTDGDTLTLDDGTVVRLVGIQAPKLPLGRPGFEAWPLADEARAALEELGLRCPEDISVTGFNDMPYVDRFAPPLTTLHIPHDELGVQAATLLLERIENPDTPTKQLRLEPRLIVRGSTAVPSA